VAIGNLLGKNPADGFSAGFLLLGKTALRPKEDFFKAGIYSL
jgi:hypothetical protein